MANAFNEYCVLKTKIYRSNDSNMKLKIENGKFMARLWLGKKNRQN